MRRRCITDRKINLLAVAHWPLGGIRTYMKYTYRYLPRDRFNITILAQKTLEEEALRRDAEEIGAKVIFASRFKGRNILFIKVNQILSEKNYDVIQSHGFISAGHVYLGNLIHRVPHILTIHGIIEENYLGHGIICVLKKAFLQKVINSTDVIYGVSQDILEHVEDNIRVKKRVKRVVIHNGIDIERFGSRLVADKTPARAILGLPDSLYLVGFVGRFMPQKGFNYLIDAVEVLESDHPQANFKVVAVGSGDLLEHYKAEIARKRIGHRFIFIPFQSDIANVYKALDVLVMPSIWEAYGLQAAEAICLGTPIIASECIGLREALKDTPAIVVPARNPEALAMAINNMMLSPPRNIFQEFRMKAIERYDVRKTSKKLGELFESLVYF